MKDALDAYAQYHVEEHRVSTASRASRKRKRRHNTQGDDTDASTLDVPRWVLNGGMAQDDWHVISQYIHYLSPLEEATHRLQGRGKSGRRTIRCRMGGYPNFRICTWHLRVRKGRPRRDRL